MSLTLTPVAPAMLTLTDATAVVPSTYGTGTYGSDMYGGTALLTLSAAAASAGVVSLAAVSPVVLTLTPA
jgi:hypothetical protein